jgi:hypothetical protein
MKKVKIKMTAEYEMEVPKDWDKEMIEFHLNNSSSCHDNAIEDLIKYSVTIGCSCDITKFEYIGE